MHRTLTTGASVLVLTTVVLAGCGQLDPLEPVLNEVKAPVYSGEELPDLEFEDRDFEIADEYRARAEYSGDVLVTVTSDRIEPTSEMTAVDATDGSTLWQLGEEDRPDLVDEADSSQGTFSFDSMVIGHDGSILLPYETTFCAGREGCTSDEYQRARRQGPQPAVVALDPADGSVVRTDAITTGEDDLHYVDARPIGSTPDAVIVNAIERSQEDGEEVSVVVALDAQDGEELWAAEGYEASFVEGDVIAALRGPVGEQERRHIALDTSMGEQMWELESGEYEGWGADYLPRTDGAAVTFADGNYGLLDLETGEVLEPLGSLPPATGLAGDEDGWLAAWVGQEDEERVLYTRASDEIIESRGALPLDDDMAVSGVSADGYIWIVDLDDESTYAVDRTGAKRSEEIEGFPALLGDGSLLVADGSALSFSRNARLVGYAQA